MDAGNNNLRANNNKNKPELRATVAVIIEWTIAKEFFED